MKRCQPRKLRTAADLRASGWTEERIRRECRGGLITRIVRGVYGEGDAKPSALDIGRATALASGGVAEGRLAGEVLRLDAVRCVVTEVVAPLTSSGKRSGVRRMLTLGGGFLTPPTESLLETLAVQLLRREPSIPTPTRQFEVVDEHGQFVGRPDLCWPEFGVFLELDGQQHEDQPVYDARRQTRITAVTGWRCGRLTWDEVNYFAVPTLRTLAQLVRPL